MYVYIYIYRERERYIEIYTYMHILLVCEHGNAKQYNYWNNVLSSPSLSLKVTPRIVPFSKKNFTMKCHCKQNRNPRMGLSMLLTNPEGPERLLRTRKPQA